MKRKKIAMHVLCFAVIFAYSLCIGCLFRRLTGIHCPFCGMTRAHLALLKGDLKSAFEFHKLFFLGIPFILGLIHLHLLKGNKILFIFDFTFLIISGIAFLINYILTF